MKEKKLLKLLDIYITFFKLGCFSFGGGYAMIPLIEREVVERKKWIEKDKIIDVFAVSQSIPGAIAMNSSAFVGYSVAGVPGAIAALLGNITPSTAIVLILSIALNKFSSNSMVDKAFKGIRPAIIALIGYAAYKMGKTSLVDTACIVMMSVSLVAAFFIHPIFIIICGAILGILITSVKSKVGKNDKIEVY